MAGIRAVTKIVHITTVPNSLHFLKGQVEFMRSRGFTIDAISSPGSRLDRFGRERAVATYPVEMQRTISPLRDVRSLRTLIKVLRSIRPTLVHAHTPKAGLLGMISARLVNAPVRVYHVRGLPYLTSQGIRRSLLLASERVACRFADRVFCVSHSIRKVMIDDGLCPAEKIVVFGGGSGNGVDADIRFNPGRFSNADLTKTRSDLGLPEDALIVLFLGRLVRDKGVVELAIAWSRLRTRFPQARLLMAGRREHNGSVPEETMIGLIEDPHVHVLGEVEDPSILYAIADMVVLPTYREGFPNVPLESAAMGKPVVATIVPGCVDAVVDGVTGTLVPAQDAAALENAIGKYLIDEELRQLHGSAGRERALRDFRQQDIWEAVYKEYVRLLRVKGIALPQAEADTKTMEMVG